MQKLNSEGNTIVLITHDNGIAKSAKRIIRLHDGQIVYDGAADDPEAVVQADVAFENDPLLKSRQKTVSEEAQQ